MHELLAARILELHLQAGHQGQVREALRRRLGTGGLRVYFLGRTDLPFTFRSTSFHCPGSFSSNSSNCSAVRVLGGLLGCCGCEFGSLVGVEVLVGFAIRGTYSLPESGDDFQPLLVVLRDEADVVLQELL
ncbi:hypothetical protein [Corallococcus sp. CA041A]|uniref:hypothetical protein n=1 Tax=Corallococcus sp. CA041A TaxID=2316727 RepID=UPI0011C39A1B|nr:hypothetical protein [Corallococcus sp. CA041A]